MSSRRLGLIFLINLCLLLNFSAHAKTILVYGDSLSAAYGLEESQGWVHLLSEKLGNEHTVINASISGETTDGGKGRLGTTLEKFKPEIVLLELGANDGLRGYSVKQIEKNLSAMSRQAQENGAQVVIFGITLPPSYGPRYIDSFEASIKSAAEKTDAFYYNYVVEHFLGDNEYVQADGLHPTAKAQSEILERVYEFLIQSELIQSN